MSACEILLLTAMQAADVEIRCRARNERRRSGARQTAALPPLAEQWAATVSSRVRQACRQGRGMPRGTSLGGGSAGRTGRFRVRQGQWTWCGNWLRPRGRTRACMTTASPSGAQADPGRLGPAPARARRLHRQDDHLRRAQRAEALNCHRHAAGVQP